MSIPRFATLCIPRMDINTSKSYIFEKFCKLNIGFIEKIIEIPINGDQLYKRVIVKLKWNTSDHAKYFMERFESGLNVKIVHSDPWFWICIPSRNYEQKIQAYMENAVAEPPNPLPLSLIHPHPHPQEIPIQNP